MKGYATFCGGAIITITSPKKNGMSVVPRKRIYSLLTVTMRCMRSPGKGAFCVGQFEAQNRLPNGSGKPSFASPWFMRAALYA